MVWPVVTPANTNYVKISRIPQGTTFKPGKSVSTKEMYCCRCPNQWEKFSKISGYHFTVLKTSISKVVFRALKNDDFIWVCVFAFF